MKAKKLKSGSWNVTVFSHMEDGKRKYASFTAPTKNEAELKAAEFRSSKCRRVHHDLTVGEAVEGYIRAKEGVLSPSTVRGYVRMSEHNLEGISRKRITTLTSEDLQIFVSELGGKFSPKTVRNVYGLLSAALTMYQPNVTYRITLPAKEVKRPTSPEDDDVRMIYAAAYPTLRVCIGLAMCGLRRGEICALRYEDIADGKAHVHADMVKDRYGHWLYKDRVKTPDGDRYVKLPQFVLDDIGEGEGYVAGIQPDTLSKQFIKYRDRLGLKMRLHDLRHYFASTAAVLMPDIYLADMGGWSRTGTASVMKGVYQNNIRSMSDYYSERMTDKLQNVIEESR